jgi:hypothetical protein
MVVGHFAGDPSYRDVPVARPLDPEAVKALQSVCDELFGIGLHLAGHLDARGFLEITDIVITRDMFRVACVAAELFGMTAFDSAHRCPVYPRPDWTADPSDEWQVRREQFERGVVEQIRGVSAPTSG